jgi:hypothetical protein
LRIHLPVDIQVERLRRRGMTLLVPVPQVGTSSFHLAAHTVLLSYCLCQRKTKPRPKGQGNPVASVASRFYLGQGTRVPINFADDLACGKSCMALKWKHRQLCYKFPSSRFICGPKCSLSSLHNPPLSASHQPLGLAAHHPLLPVLQSQLPPAPVSHKADGFLILSELW